MILKSAHTVIYLEGLFQFIVAGNTNDKKINHTFQTWKKSC